MRDKPREFWICSWDNDVTYAEYFVSNVDFKNLSEDDDYMRCKDRNSIHVIEAGPVLEKIARLEKCLEKCKEQRDEFGSEIPGGYEGRSYEFDMVLESILEGK